jgi:HNH endonuclease
MGQPVVIQRQLGQASFRLAVLDAYDRQCAVTTEHSRPVLEAAHVRPWAAGDGHEIPNGVPLRRDLHGLFDLGYVTIRPDLTVAVSNRLRDDYANGQAYYQPERSGDGLPRVLDAGAPRVWPLPRGLSHVCCIRMGMWRNGRP